MSVQFLSQWNLSRSIETESVRFLLIFKAEAPERMELERLNGDLDLARGEVDRLLRIVQNLEKEREGLGEKIKDMQK